MKRTIATLCVMAMLFQLLPAADIYLKNGTVVKNVQIVGVREKFGQPNLFFMFNDKETYVVYDVVLRIDAGISYDSLAKSQLIRPGGIPLEDTPSAAQSGAPRPLIREDSLKQLYERLSVSYAPPRKEYRNLAWISVSVLSLGLAWDFMERAQDYQKMADGYSSSTVINGATYTTVIPPNAEASSAASRMNILAIISLGAGVAATIQALTPVEVKTDGKSLTMTVPF